MKTFSFKMHIDRDDDELEVAVSYNITPYRPATWDWPAEGGEIEIESAEFVEANTHPSPLTDDEMERIRAEIEDRCVKDLIADIAEEADYRFEQMRDARNEAS